MKKFLLTIREFNCDDDFVPYEHRTCETQFVATEEVIDDMVANSSKKEVLKNILEKMSKELIEYCLINMEEETFRPIKVERRK